MTQRGQESFSRDNSLGTKPSLVQNYGRINLEQFEFCVRGSLKQGKKSIFNPGETCQKASAR